MKTRCSRSATRAVVGSPRDLEALASLAWMTWLGTGQLAALHFPSRRVAQRRLRALLDHGLVRARLQDRSLCRDSIFALSRAGAARLEATGMDPSRASAGRWPAPRGLAHGLLVRDAFVAFRVAERQGLVLDDFLLAGDLQHVGPFAEARLVPDALAVLGDGRRIAIEADLGTEPLRVLAGKLERYAPLLRLGELHSVVFLLGAARRGLPDLVASHPSTDIRIVEAANLSTFAMGYSRDPVARPLRAERTGFRRQASEIIQESPPPAGAFRRALGAPRRPREGGG